MYAPWYLVPRLDQAILPSDWNRALRYICRVRCFICFSDSPDLVNVFEILRLTLPVPHLFPQLRCLRWISFPPTFLLGTPAVALPPPSSLPPFISLARFLFTPTLTNISLGTFTTIAELSLPVLALKCPLLTHIEIHQDVGPGIDPSRVISSFICGLDHIKSLEVAHLDQKAHDHLLALPGLETLSLTAPNINASTTPPHLPPTSGPRFASLCDVTLNSTPSQSILAFIPSLSHSPLESFELHYSLHDASSVRQIFAALKEYLPRTTLRRICVVTRAHRMAGGHPTVPAITIETLRLLFHFTNLTSVELRPPTGIDVTDEDVLAMAEAWPHLEDLLLRTRPTDHPPRATLHSLLHLAKHCAKLATLELIVDASTIPTIECNEDKTRLLQSALLDWTVGHSLISSPIEVARFLSGIFPILNGTWSSEDYDDDGSDTEMQSYWGEILGSGRPVNGSRLPFMV
ncbi:hypothetical protein C8F04DRAFT_1268576 [Mycena alexandri]|uniref:F-box domain-containing protein n=1 Tax=Mycena alexandri TaxID=1745969 RepID=A0AAD6SEY5_9AGAR|nr:hypothetical protein C8F04DRAFT_1268576 [Mycena alexandri]